MKKQPLVKVQELSKSYSMKHGWVHALKNINLSIYPGDSLAIMGASGSGKSTLLHLLGCLDKPSTGNYFLDQQNTSLLSDPELAFLRASKIGFVFQSFNLIPQLTVFENVEVPFLYQMQVLNPLEIKKRILDSLHRVGLSHRLTHLPNQLSGGETQRVAIARALAIQPLLILADEPTGNLDTETGQTILQLFQDLNQQGVTLVIVTHDLHVGDYCKRLVRMRDGAILSDQFNVEKSVC